MKSLCLVFLFVPVLFAGPVEDLQPGEWYEVPNSRMDALDPCPARNCCYSAVEGISAVMNDWSGGAYDTKRDRLMVWGGGHCGYAGNEIYAFSMDSLKWYRLNDPVACADLPFPECGPTCQTYYDSTPSSRHAYDGLEYLPEPVDGFFSSGGAVWGGGGPGCTGGSGTWVFKIATMTWHHLAAAPDGRNGNETAYDPVTGHIFQRGGCWLAEYDPVNDTWTNRYNGGSLGCFWSYDGSGEIDPTRQLMVFTGNGSDAWGVYNIGTGQYSRPATSGDNSIQSRDGGLVYDPVSDKMVAWQGGANVYMLDLDTWTWTRVSPAASNTVTPTAGNSNGTFGRWRYVPSRNVFIGVNATDENVYIYKLTAGGGTGKEAKAKAGEKGSICVSPNPFRTSVHIRTDMQNALLTIFDLNGRKIFSGASGNAVWHAAGRPAGVYVLKIKSGRQILTKQLLLQP
jgi:hypothetical protein